MDDEFITIARIAKTQGRFGEVAAELFTDFPERFAQRRKLFVLDQSGSRREFHLDNFWPHKGRVILKFSGIDSISAAEPLVGGEVQIRRDERAELEPGAAYVTDLVGCTVIVEGAATGGTRRELGTVARVQFGAGEAPLLQLREGGRELLIPLAAEFIRKLDPGARIIELVLPEGMLDLDAPLSAEERDAQKRT